MGISQLEGIFFSSSFNPFIRNRGARITLVDKNQNIEVKGCVKVEEHDSLIFIIKESVNISSLDNSPILVYNRNCEELKVKVMSDGEGVECEEAIKERKKLVEQGSKPKSFLSSHLKFFSSFQKYW